ncbi:PP2C family protein-serine/threonine phosphatase [Streptomyces sp. NPDC001941]|uniref:PP2C family protein-serine/threonine phosphatase n=1 Tax=Streptomyces sp. NPDC001941 TaxID=3154659 RepID=UPI00332E7858
MKPRPGRPGRTRGAVTAGVRPGPGAPQPDVRAAALAENRPTPWPGQYGPGTPARVREQVLESLHPFAEAVVLITEGCARGARVTRRNASGGHDSYWCPEAAAAAHLLPGLPDALAPSADPGDDPVHCPFPDPPPAWLLPGEPVAYRESLLLPLCVWGRRAGTVLLFRRDPAPAFVTPDGGPALRAVAAMAALSLHAAQLQHELDRLTGQLRRPLPATAQRLLGRADIAVSFRPRPEGAGVGGDFYCFLPPGTPDTVVVGDVCGHDTAAAVRAAALRNRLIGLSRPRPHHRDVLRRLNALDQDEGPGAGDPGVEDPAFASLAMVTVTDAGPGLDLGLSSAGHPPPLVLRRDGRVRRTKARGVLIGVLPDPEYETERLRLEPGETCLVYSDGATDARGPAPGPLLGEERLAEFLASCRGLPAAALLERLDMLIARWLDGADHDDLTLVAIQARTGQDRGT